LIKFCMKLLAVISHDNCGTRVQNLFALFSYTIHILPVIKTLMIMLCIFKVSVLHGVPSTKVRGPLVKVRVTEHVYSCTDKFRGTVSCCT
jgi:hypothetical protein